MHYFGYIAALTAVILWSFNVVIAARFATDLSPLEFAFGRWFFAVLILIPMAWEGLYKNVRWFLKHWVWLVGLSITGIVLDNTLIYMAGHTLSAVNMGLLNVIAPIFLVFLTAFFLKTKITWLQITGIGIAVIGVIGVISNGQLKNLLEMHFVSGDVFMILNALCFAIYSFLQFKKPAFMKQSTLLAATVILGVLMLLPALLWQTPVARLKQLGTDEYAVLIYLGIFNSVIAYLAWNTALAKIGSLKTGIIYYTQPLFSLLEAALILGEPLYFGQIWGGALIIAGILIVNHPPKSGTH